MKKIIVINLGWEQEPLLDLIDKKGFEIYGIHYNQDYYKKPRYKDVFITDLRDLVKILNYAEKIKPDAVISDQCDYSYFAQAVIAEKFKLPGPRIKEAQIAVNKYFQRIEAKKNNILSPEFKLCASIEDVFSFIDAVKPPIILKPVDNRGSFGVNRVDNINEINEAFYDALINSHSRYILAEKFIEGIHITVDGYVFKNSGCKSLALATKKMLKSAKRQVAIDILYPGELSEKLYDKALAINEQVNSQLGFKFGITHSEYMITYDEKIYLIETANRGGGCFTSEIIMPAVSDVDILSQYISDSIGEKQNFYNDLISKNQVILKFFSFNSGKLIDIKGIDKMGANPNILKFKILVEKGDKISKVTTDADRHAFMIFKYKGDNIRSEVENSFETLEAIYEK